MKYPCLLTKKINEISSAKYNPRKITDEAMGRLTKSLAEFGNIQPITWNARTGNVVGGHQRLKVYKAMGKTEVDVWAVDLDEQKEKAANIALNKLSGEFDMPMLKDILEEIDTGDLDMEITGFGMDEIALMMEDAHPEVTEDEVPEVPVDAITKPGDLWLLGEHRVLCGDSTSEADVSRLMNGEKADMVFTDPPYGVDYEGVTNDHLKGEKLRKFIYDCLTNVNLNLRDGANYYIWHPDIHAYEFIGAIRDVGWRQARPSTIQWVKDSLVLSQGDYHSRNEPCLYGWKEGKNRQRVEDRTQDTIWEYPKPKKSDGHPTMKPIKLCERAIKNSSKLGWLIIDTFLGSGSTLIAAEQLGRKCYGIEISPNYCDVIVKRWENLTGKKATLAK
jgi:DNA modification methylase